MTKRQVLLSLLTLLACLNADAEEPPNVILILADDLGYGDLGSYGHPTIRTPNLDQMAAEGIRFTQFYAAASVCTPSRAALLTGRYPIRNGMTSDASRVLFPDSVNGLPNEEVTIAEALKKKDYATAAIGKWHLGHHPEYLPLNNGFDSYYGIPYSNDMDRVVGGGYRDPFWDPKIEYWNVPLMQDNEIIERPADQNTITRRYTEQAIQFIQENQDRPFFLYLAHSLPHVPLFRDAAFAGVSKRGLYGDVIEEIDWSTGRIIETLRETGLAENTFVFFTSDNGPWLIFDTHGGSAGLLRGGKGMTWEGGMREPAIAWWPGTIAPGSVEPALTTAMDLFPTVLAMADVALPADRQIDGRNMVPLLTGASSAEIRDVFLFYRGTRIYAARKGKWKAHFITEWEYEADNRYTAHDPVLLYDLHRDPSEQYDVADQFPEIIDEIIAAVAEHQADLTPYPDQLADRTGAATD
jgi:arylsulfatase A-like enzyme